MRDTVYIKERCENSLEGKLKLFKSVLALTRQIRAQSVYAGYLSGLEKPYNDI